MTEVHDPYGGCEDACTHDLARGALVEDLRDGDGPYPDQHPLFTTDPSLSRGIAQPLAASAIPTR